jgi:hypothetical protein
MMSEAPIWQQLYDFGGRWFDQNWNPAFNEPPMREEGLEISRWRVGAGEIGGPR